MAIAAVVLHSTGSLQSIEKILRAFPWIVDVQQVPPDKMAVTLESPSDRITKDLQTLGQLPDVWNLELVYVNYEDDLDSNGHMNCPSPEFIHNKRKE